MKSLKVFILASILSLSATPCVLSAPVCPPHAVDSRGGIVLSNATEDELERTNTPVVLKVGRTDISAYWTGQKARFIAPKSGFYKIASPDKFKADSDYKKMIAISLKKGQSVYLWFPERECDFNTRVTIWQ